MWLPRLSLDHRLAIVKQHDIFYISVKSSFFGKELIRAYVVLFYYVPNQNKVFLSYSYSYLIYTWFYNYILNTSSHFTLSLPWTVLRRGRDFLPKYTQIHHKIISFLLFWDVLWITNDLLAPDVLIFFMNFNKIVSFYGQYHYQTNPISVGSLTITNIPKYTLKFRLSKVWYI